MRPGPVSDVLRQLRRAFPGGDGAAPTDGQLLEAFVRDRDAAAVEALVRRHGPMVWGVCRRVLGRHHDAEDAFQATFLVLVRRAGSIRPSGMVGPWLHGVARRTALKAKAVRLRREQREQPAAADAPAPPAADDLRDLLDRELDRLPARYRAVLVLCDLQGHTRAEAARRLGLPEGTVASRAARGRALLAKRLGRHAPAALGALAPHAVPGGLAADTIRTAAGCGTAGLIPAPILTLSEGVVRTMFLTRLKVVSVAAAVVAAALTAGGTFGGRTTAGQDPAAPKPVGPAEKAGRVVAPADGVVTEVLVGPGQRVKAGEVLAVVGGEGLAVAKPALPVGTWTVGFANGVVEMCDIGNDGKATVVEPRRGASGFAEAKGGAVVISFDDDRVERWTPVGNRYVVEHWFPASRVLTTAPVLGIADRPVSPAR